jgi:hypothetical protein
MAEQLARRAVHVGGSIRRDGGRPPVFLVAGEPVQRGCARQSVITTPVGFGLSRSILPVPWAGRRASLR